MTDGIPGRAWPRELLWAVLVIAVATMAYGWAARSERPAPAGLVGHGLGVAGFLLMVVAETAYTWRKRPTRTGPGPAVRWLEAHVFVGLVGPYLVLLHTAFRFRGLAGVLTLLMAVVVGSGVAGRYWYTTALPVGPERPRRALWYVLHVPLSAVLFALAAFHVVGVLYYAGNLR